MDVFEILTRKGIKKLEARELTAQAILDGDFAPESFDERRTELNEKQIATLLEAIEMITCKKLKHLDSDYLRLAVPYIGCENNSCKREASRIVGNMAADYPDELADAIPLLIENTKNDGTVVRWGSAYALSRIILLDCFRDSELLETVKSICKAEQENGVKNQYVKALRRIKVI